MKKKINKGMCIRTVDSGREEVEIINKVLLSKVYNNTKIECLIGDIFEEQVDAVSKIRIINNDDMISKTDSEVL